MSIEQFLRELWNSYIRITPSAGAIMDLFTHWGESVRNDQILIRTLNDPRVNITVISRSFIDKGYVTKVHETPPDKKMSILHLEHPESSQFPKVLISELHLEAFSPVFREIISNTLHDTPKGIFKEPDLVLKGRIWGVPSYDIYETLRGESEYAAWIYVFGFCVNHFTVSVNFLRNFESLHQVNSFLQSNGFPLNTAGGIIKGGPEHLLEESRTVADRVRVHFREGDFMIPACNYGFARRYTDVTGQLYGGYSVVDDRAVIIENNIT